MSLLKSFKAKSEGVMETEQLRDIFSQEIKRFGYDAFDVYGLRSGSEDNPRQGANFYLSDFGNDFIEQFIQKNLLLSDPIMQYLGNNSAPFDFVAFLRDSPKSISRRWQLSMLKLNDIHQAWCIPLNTIGMIRGMTIYLCGYSAVEQDFFIRTRDEVHVAGTYFMHLYDQIRMPMFLDQHMPVLNRQDFTHREITCLHWVARGKTNWEIAQILEISENTVRYHLKQVFKKLNVNTRSKAVTAALQLGLIDI